LRAEKKDPLVRVAELGEVAAWEKFLSAGERERVGKISNETLRARFVISRGLRRAVLADCTRRAAGDLEFYEDGESKPRLVDGEGWDFNVSHAGDYVVVVAGRGALGVDLEMIREVREMSALVRRYFHADEARAWETLAQEERQEGFFALWSAREAAMKCCGLGLAKGLAVTRVDPEFLGQRLAQATVSDAVVEVEKLDAPVGYVLVVGKLRRRDET
jgi:4'-phosphopantetheinyl transferase